MAKTRLSEFLTLNLDDYLMKLKEELVAPGTSYAPRIDWNLNEEARGIRTQTWYELRMGFLGSSEAAVKEECNDISNSGISYSETISRIDGLYNELRAEAQKFYIKEIGDKPIENLQATTKDQKRRQRVGELIKRDERAAEIPGPGEGPIFV